MALMTLPASMGGAVLADNLGIALAILFVLLETDKAFLSHSGTSSNAMESYQFYD
jgi:hypothetical protein